MRDYISIGSTPHAERCLPAGSPHNLQRRECSIFANQILRHYPIPQGANLTIKANQHEYGTYFEVNAYYDEDDPSQVEWAYAVEADELDKLEYWDDLAKEELNN